MILRFFRSAFSRKKRAVVLRTQGNHHDLKAILDEVNHSYFEGKLDLKITWFGPAVFTPKRRIKLGSYNLRTRLIKIHRILDRPHIPNYYVSSIVYHEMLHHILPPRRKGKRREIHHCAFLEAEKNFRAHAQAKEFHAFFRKELFNK